MEKKYICLFIILFKLVYNSYAQQMPSLIINIGPSLSTFSRIAFEDFKPILRVSSSISLLSPLSKILAIRTQIAYEKKGVKGEKFGELDARGTNLIDQIVPISRYNYLTLPVVLEYSFGNKVKYSFGLGAYAAYLVRIKDILDKDIEGQDKFIRKDFSKINRFDFGLSASANVKYPISEKFAFNLNLLHNRSLTPLVKKEIFKPSVYHRCTNLLFGLSYSFNK